MKILTLFIACLLFAFSLPARIMEQVYDTNNAATVDAHVLSLFTNGIATTSTNFNSGFVYTNDSSQGLLVLASIGMNSTDAGGATAIMQIWLYPTNGGAVFAGKTLMFPFAGLGTLTNTIACIIPPHYGYVFTNVSGANGNTVIMPNSGQIVAIGAGPQGPQGPVGPSGAVDTNANNIWSGINQFNNSSNMFSGNVITNLSTVYCVTTNSYFWNGSYYAFGNCDAMFANLSTNYGIWAARTNASMTPLYGGTIELGDFDYWLTNRVVFYVTNTTPSSFTVVGNDKARTRILNNNTNQLPYGLLSFISGSNSLQSADANVSYTPTLIFEMRHVGLYAADTTNCMLLVIGANAATVEDCFAANIGALTNAGSGFGALQLGDVPYESNGAIPHYLTLMRFRSQGDNGVVIKDSWFMGARYGVVLDMDHSFLQDLWMGGFRGVSNTNCAAVVDRCPNKSSFDTFHLVVNDIGIQRQISLQNGSATDSRYSKIHCENVAIGVNNIAPDGYGRLQLIQCQDVTVAGTAASAVFVQDRASFSDVLLSPGYIENGNAIQDTNYITITGSTIASVNGVYVRGYNIGKIGVWTNSAGSTNAIVQDDPAFNVLASVTNSLCLEATNLINTGSFLLLYYPASFTISSANGAWSDNATLDNNVFGSIRLINTITITNSNVLIGNNGGVIEQKDVWILHDVTNNMPNFSYKTANSNGVAFVSIYMSNGVPHIKQLAP